MNLIFKDVNITFNKQLPIMVNFKVLKMELSERRLSLQDKELFYFSVIQFFLTMKKLTPSGASFQTCSRGCKRWSSGDDEKQSGGIG